MRRHLFISLGQKHFLFFKINKNNKMQTQNIMQHAKLHMLFVFNLTIYNVFAADLR